MKSFKKRMISLAAIACMAALLVCATACTTPEEYTPEEGSATIASPTIGEDGVLRVGVDTSNAPLAGESSSSGEVVGIDVDIAAALADQFGLKVEIVDVGSDAATALEEGTVDIVMGIESSNTSETYWLSDSYLDTAVALFNLADGSTDLPTNDSSLTIAAQVSSKSAWAVANEYDEGVISTTSNLEDALTALESGEVQYVAADAVIGTYAAYSSDLDVQMVALLEDTSGYSIAVLDSNDELKQQVSNALATLSDSGVIDVIESKWLGEAPDLSAVPQSDGSTTSEDSSESEESEESSDELETGSNAVSEDEVE